MTKSPIYTNLALKYRPQTIDTLIGQEVLVQTLSNAFSLNMIASAFMLTGTRGVGKTTTARIIAKALNCTGPDGKGDITLFPCGMCEACVSITADHYIDVIEIDAASRTGVDDIREIIENSRYKPVVARFKIFIIDEVHMLSKSAFNALLKTLEEPPAHVKFIFATTEIRKVPITILSRCQRFDLKRITTPTLQQHITNICNTEGITFEDNALFLIAKAGSGSARDTLSLLDQAIIHSNKNITVKSVEDMLGIADKSAVYNLLLNIIKNNHQPSFDILQQLTYKGLSYELLIEDLANIVHFCAVYLTINNLSLLELSDSESNLVIEISQATNLPTVITLWQVLLQGYTEVKEATNPENYVNMLLIKLLFANQINDISNHINQDTISIQTPSLAPISNIQEISANNTSPQENTSNTSSVSSKSLEDKLLETFPNIRK